MSGLLSTVARWIQLDPDARTAAELQELLDDAGDNHAAYDALERLFAGRLAFGTAGLRAELGPGPLRMNRLVIRQTAAGLLHYAAEQLQRAAITGEHRIVIGYDARHQSDEFAFETAEVFLRAGWKVHLFDKPGPTPLLARQVMVQDADVGVMVTASHNPPSDNGYKVYLGGKLSRFLEPDGLGVGAQIVSPFDEQIAAAIADLVEADSAPTEAGAEATDPDAGLAGVRAPTGAAVIGEQAREDYQREALQLLDVEAYPHRDLRVVYTAMHGVGGQAVTDLLTAAGFTVLPVAEQFEPDPDFPTAAFPNPEEEGALDLALQAAAEHDADLVLANDPDADRLSAAVYDPAVSAWRQLSGDEMGALLGAHIMQRGPLRAGWQTTESAPGPVLGNSVVSSRLLGKLCAARGIGHEETLTGFKWLARVPNITFGYEEAIGFDVDPVHVRDKDGIAAALIFCELMADLKAAGRSALTALDEIAADAGAHLTSQVTVRVEDLSQLGSITAALRSSPPDQIADSAVVESFDLLRDPLPGQEFSKAKSTDVLIYLTAEDDRVIVRPSGTEPKVKCYLEAVAHPESSSPEEVSAARRTAAERLAELRSAMEEVLN